MITNNQDKFDGILLPNQSLEQMIFLVYSH